MGKFNLNKIDYMKKKLIVNLIILAFTFANNNQEDSIIPDLDIKLLNGKTTTINQLLEDGPLLIDFWATWCKPCKKVMKHLDRYDTMYSDKGFKVLMINQDTPRSMGKVRSYIRSQKYQFLVGLDPNQKIAQKLKDKCNVEFDHSLNVDGKTLKVCKLSQLFTPQIEHKPIERKGSNY